MKKERWLSHGIPDACLQYNDVFSRSAVRQGTSALTGSCGTQRYPVCAVKYCAGFLMSLQKAHPLHPIKPQESLTFSQLSANKGVHVADLGNAPETLKRELHSEIGPVTSKRTIGPKLNVTFRGASGFLPVTHGSSMWELEASRCGIWRLDNGRGNGAESTKALPGYLPDFFRFSSGT